MFVGINLGINLRSSVSFSPSSLFAAGEPGVWFDPSDVANLSWLVNLLQWTQEFDNAVWTKNIGGIGGTPVVTANAGVAPDSTSTADRIQFTLNGGTSTADVSDVRQLFLSTAAPCTFSFWIKSFDGSSSYQMLVRDGNGFVNPITVTGSWQRYAVSSTFAVPNGTCGFGIRGGQGTVNSNTADVLVWGAQVELGSVATTYQPITTVAAGTDARFPNATLYRDTAGTSPVTTPGQTVALMLDKSRGLALGSELVTTASGVVTTGSYTPGVSVVAGKTYLFSYTISANVGTMSASWRVFFAGGQLYAPSVNIGFNGSVTARVTALSSGTLTLSPDSAGTNFSISNVSIRELPGNHATQATPASMPTYGIVPRGGRRNILTFSEQFDNAAWSKLNATITANSSVAPDGTSTADLVSSTGGETRVGLNPGVVLPSTTYTASMFGKYANANGRYLWFRDFFSGRDVGFDLQTGVVTQVASGMTASVVPAGEGFFRCIVSWTTPATAVVANQQFWVLSASGTNPSTGLAGGQFYLWGAQIEQSTTATSYQRVGTEYDVTQAGVPSMSYIQFNGINNSMATGTITPGTDKVQVFAGVRKLANGNNSCIVELSAVASSNNGAFYILTGRNVSGPAPAYTALSRGTAFVSLDTADLYDAPISNLLTLLSDISGDTAKLRANGTQVAQSTGDQGTGNYLAYPLYVGSRAGSSLYFNGQLYSLIDRFGPNLPSNTITSTEAWVAGKTGFYPPIITGVPTIGVS